MLQEVREFLGDEHAGEGAGVGDVGERDEELGRVGEDAVGD